MKEINAMPVCRAATIAFAALVCVLYTAGCSRRDAAPPRTAVESSQIVAEVIAHRAEVDSFFRYDPASPFLNDTSAHYDGIKWFPPDAGYCVRSKLHRYQYPAAVTVFGTKGEERKQLRYGYFQFTRNGADIRLNAYKDASADPRRDPRLRNYLSVWFTDATTGKETYEVGRYLEVGEELPDPEALYTLNFNNAYNPYCSYSARYSCAIPTRDDALGVAVRAGEMKYGEMKYHQ